MREQLERRIRKVPEWLNMEGRENDHAIRRSMGKWYCLPIEEVVSEV